MIHSRFGIDKLVILSQVHCSALNQARLNVLSEVKNSVHQIQTSKQAGSLRSASRSTRHFLVEVRRWLVNRHFLFREKLCPFCYHAHVLPSPFTRLVTANGAPCGHPLPPECNFVDQEGASFERVQIVRLDPRQISILRYHIATGYENFFIPIIILCVFICSDDIRCRNQWIKA